MGVLLCSRFLGGVAAAVCMIVICHSTANYFSSDNANVQPESLESIFDLTSALRKRPRTDLDPGSFEGLVQAAESDGSRGRDEDSTSGSGRRRHWSRHGLKHINGPALSLQQHETTQRRIERNLRAAHQLKRSLGNTIARYFSTVRTVKDDQGTFLG